MIAAAGRTKGREIRRLLPGCPVVVARAARNPGSRRNIAVIHVLDWCVA
jgi:hypothetical protein